MCSFLASKENRRENRDEEKPHILCLRKQWLVETPVTLLKTLYHEFGIHVIFKFPRIILAHFFFMRRYYVSENP
jgi:hypothetical protein